MHGALVLCCFLVLFTRTRAANPLEDEMLANLALLEDFELKQLRDFVRGKGRGFVSKIPFDAFGNPQDEDDMNPGDPDVVNIGQQMNMMPSLIVPSIIYPSSTTTRRPPPKPKKKKDKQKFTKEDFKELAHLFQQFIDNRKGGHKPTSPLTTTARTTTTIATTTTATPTTQPTSTTTRRVLNRWRMSQTRGAHRFVPPKPLPVITTEEQSWKGSVAKQVR
ncbi:hypothetical protein QR680_018276 [Steinernema hermaphroditum]|uniref:Uncharacterized protein n=1 Tax=Steinernema hermaphroditum TaxID=289476 RepID=A0AA39LQV4_9BILA|nr:hypothetical protein QR680_018276 [Steinernema hermaphroditum]